MDSTNTGMPSGGAVPDVIDVQSDHAVETWATKLDVTAAQVRDAVEAVGDRAADVEMHLKGSRSISNVDRVEEAGG